MGDDSLNVVPVLQGHLADLERTLESVEGLLVSLDLQAQFQKMETLHRPSKLTKAIQEHRERIQGYLAFGEEYDGPPET